MRKLSQTFIKEICANLAANKKVRRTMPLFGRIHIDRQLPFLCVYRNPVVDDDLGTARLIAGQASYLMASGDNKIKTNLKELVKSIVETLSKEFGAFLLFEIWTEEESEADPDIALFERNPYFRIVTSGKNVPLKTVNTLRDYLSKTKINKLRAEVEVTKRTKVSPPGLQPIISAAEAARLNCHLVGLEMRPVYRDPKTHELFPAVRRNYLRALTKVLHQAFYVYAHNQTTHQPPHYHSLGRHAVVKAVWEIDDKLAAISSAFDFLWYVTPINSESSWNEFKRSKFQKRPVFHYRPQLVQPDILKRKLWNIPIQKLEDPTIGQLFREKRLELDIQMSMLENIDSDKFLYGSMHLYGKISKELLDLSLNLLEKIRPRSREGKGHEFVNAKQFAERARKELSYYRERYPELRAKVQIRNDLTGLMVSKGNLFVSSATSISEARVEALINHEIGTHVVTYFNGKAQPFHQLNYGLADYEELQEGLAVFSEYLVAGLSGQRLRLLAARVLAAQHLIDGASFVETFNELYKKYEFAQRTAYGITVRIYRGGGLTKDMVYFRGLLNLMNYIKKGQKLEPLFAGKIAAKHIPIVEELMYRKLLRKAPLVPRYMELPSTRERVERVRNGLGVHQLIERRLK